MQYETVLQEPYESFNMEELSLDKEEYTVSNESYNLTANKNKNRITCIIFVIHIYRTEVSISILKSLNIETIF